MIISSTYNSSVTSLLPHPSVFSFFFNGLSTNSSWKVYKRNFLREKWTSLDLFKDFFNNLVVASISSLNTQIHLCRPNRNVRILKWSKNDWSTLNCAQKSRDSALIRIVYCLCIYISSVLFTYIIHFQSWSTTELWQRKHVLFCVSPSRYRKKNYAAPFLDKFLPA